MGGILSKNVGWKHLEVPWPRVKLKFAGRKTIPSGIFVSGWAFSLQWCRQLNSCLTNKYQADLHCTMHSQLLSKIIPVKDQTVF